MIDLVLKPINEQPLYTVLILTITTLTIVFAWKVCLIPNKWKMLKNWRYSLKLQNISKQAKSLNHTAILLAKTIYGIEINQDEDELTSFADIRGHYGEDWPFQMPVSNTRSKNVTVHRNGDWACYPISSYSYLGLVQHEELTDFAVQKARQWATGNHGARMLGGNIAYFHEVEQAIADFQHKERAMIMSSGQLACMSTVAAICKKEHVIIYDQYCHACLKSGMTLSKATLERFKHNNLDDAERLMKKQPKRKKVMLVESLQSMDGDVVDLPRARAICDKYGALLIMDEAHGLGSIGKTGRGAVEFCNTTYENNADIVVGTFSKSLASVGGFVCASKQIIDQFEFFSQGNMFSAAISVFAAAVAHKALDVVVNTPSLVEQLHANCKLFRSKILAVEWGDFPEKSRFSLGGMEGQPIFPIIFYLDPTRVVNIAVEMKKRGFMVAPVVAPACPLREPRLRITCTSNLTEDVMDRFVEALVDCAKNIPFANQGLMSILDD